MKLTKENIEPILSTLEKNAVLWIQFYSVLKRKINFLISKDSAGLYQLVIFENNTLQLAPIGMRSSRADLQPGRTIKAIREILRLYLVNEMLCECCFLDSHIFQEAEDRLVS